MATDEDIVRAPAGSDKPSLLRETGAGAAGSAFALAAGIGLDLTLALLLGAGPETDALFVALRIPLGLAIFFPPTAIQVLVPAMTGWMEEGDVRSLNSRTTAAAVATFAATGAMALLGVLLAPLLVRVQAPGFSASGHALAASLARATFLLIPLTATSQVFRAYRHARRRHGLAAALQGAVGVTVATVLLTFAVRANVSMAAWAYVAGGALQLVLAVILAMATGFSLTRGRILTAETKALGRRSARPLAASGVQLATRVGEQVIASFLSPGSITILSYANRLVSAIGGTLFFRPVVTSFLGHMSRFHARGDKLAVRSLVRDGLRILSVVSIALTALVVLAGPPFVAGLFSLGDMTPGQAALLGTTVAVYAASLPSAGPQRILLGATFARLETSSYLRNTIYGALANALVLGGLFLAWDGAAKLLIVPIAYSVAQIVNVWHASNTVRSWLGSPLWPGRELAVPLLLTGLSVGVMAPVRWLMETGLSGRPLSLVVSGLVTSVIGIGVLAIGLWVWSPQELKGAFRIEREEGVSGEPGSVGD
jgi:putative peptidoglycan lipid II flippase